jgi:hypothetical protein
MDPAWELVGSTVPPNATFDMRFADGEWARFNSKTSIEKKIDGEMKR